MAGYTKDSTLEALELAGDIWEKTAMAAKVEKMGYAADLHRMAHFSLPQIAKIVRINARFIYEEFTPNAKKGGRFDPQALSTLVRIRRAHLQGERIPNQLISMGIQGGMSYSCLTALTGIPYSAYYEVARHHSADYVEPVLNEVERNRRDRLIEEKKLALEERRRQEVCSLKEQGWTIYAIAKAFTVQKEYVSKVLRGER